MKAVTKFVRISPQKARRAADLVRGMNAMSALDQLRHAGTKGALILLKTLSSAVANAKMEHGLRDRDLVIADVRVDDGPRLKRSKSKNKGGRHPVLKRMSHFSVELQGGV